MNGAFKIFGINIRSPKIFRYNIFPTENTSYRQSFLSRFRSQTKTTASWFGFGSRLHFISGSVEHMCFSALHLITALFSPLPTKIQRNGPSPKRDISQFCPQIESTAPGIVLQYWLFKGSFVLFRKRLRLGMPFATVSDASEGEKLVQKNIIMPPVSYCHESLLVF